MYTLTVTRGFETFRFDGWLYNLIAFAGEWDTSYITDPDGVEVYALSFDTEFLKIV